MKIEISSIAIVDGSFKLSAPTKDEDRTTLAIACRYQMIGVDGKPLASGVITNVKDIESKDGLVLSKSSLEAFLLFFRSLEDDIANSFNVRAEGLERSHEGSSHGNSALAEILERQAAGQPGLPV